MFCSTSIFRHLARGIAAAALLILAFHFAETHPAWTVLAVIGALLLMRGCPTCWLVGLVQAIAARRALKP